ncbi:site-specific integrase [Microbacterium natoriense]|uniref:tyrosine-type recombinase/integrase n=1 Tax=Microbacterium natoriense TaxID=284570 RepID=UPI0031D4ED37
MKPDREQATLTKGHTMRGKGEGSVFKDSRGLWNGVIELPPLNGERRRKTIRRKNKKDLLDALAQAKSELRRLGDLPTQNQTVEQWFRYWLKQVSKEVRPNTFDGYKRTVENHIIPSIGTVKLDKLTAAHVRRVHDGILAKGLSSTTALLAHRAMSVSLKMAMREGRIGRNPAQLTAPPRVAAKTLDVLTLPESVALLKDTLESDNGVRDATYLLTAARRGEIIGLEEDRLGDVLDLSWQLQRILYSHGCGGKCGARRGADCPDRTINVPADYEYRHIVDGLYWTRPKSRKGWRVIPLVDPLRSILEQHMSQMPANPHGLVFAREDGRPIDPKQASADWRSVMKERFGEDRYVRLHDLRHTTVDLLLLAGVPEDIVMEIVGHSTRAQTREYKSRANVDRLRLGMEQMSMLFTPHELERRREIGA